MSAPSSDRNLLLGILALQMDFITPDAMIQAMHQWTLQKARSLSDILAERGALDPADRIALDQMVDRHIARHGGDARQSLSALEARQPARSVFEAIDDPDIQESLSSLSSVLTRRIFEPQTGDTESWGEMPPEGDGRFQVLRLHDQGGLGIVYLARDREVKRDVALKQLNEIGAGDPQTRARFVLEAEITGNLEHPGIVPVYGMGKNAEGRPYYAMRFVKGETFKEAVDHFHHDPALLADTAARQREFQKLLRRFLTVCETMEYAHSRGIIHRDLKPRNILLGPYGETLVVDWGLAKVVGHGDSKPPPDATLRPPSSSEIEPTLAGSLLGTAAFMSPEQARGEVAGLGPATDIYGLGATLYYFLAGRPPFDAADRDELIRKVQKGEFRAPREVKSTVDRALDAVCRRAMALRPENRYPSARALGDDLERWLADQPVSAHSEALHTRAARWVRRHRHLVASAVSLLLLVLVGMSIHVWQLGLEQNRTRQAFDKSSENLAMTRAALRKQLESASTSLARYPNTGPAREKLVVDALEIYKLLLESYATDPEIRFEAADVYRTLGALQRRAGKLAGALYSYQQSLDLFVLLVNHPRRGMDALYEIAQTRIDRGELYRMNGMIRPAEQDYASALEWVERLNADPDPAPRLVLKASALIDRSEVRYTAGRAREAQADAGEAILLLESLVHNHSQWRNNGLWLLAMACTDRGMAALQRSEVESGRNDLLRALVEARKIPSTSHFYYDALYVIAVTQRQLGGLEAEHVGRSTGARERLDEAITLLQRLVKDRGDVPSYREELAACFCARGLATLSAGLIEQAERDSQAAARECDQLREPDIPNPNRYSLLGRIKVLESQVARRRGMTDRAREQLEGAVALLGRALSADRDRELDRRTLSGLKEEIEGLKAAAER